METQDPSNGRMSEAPSAKPAPGSAESSLGGKEVVPDGASREVLPREVRLAAGVSEADNRIAEALAATTGRENAGAATTGTQPVLTAISDLEMIALAAITKANGEKTDGAVPGYSAHALREMAAAHKQERGTDSEILLALAAAAELEENVKAEKAANGSTGGSGTGASSLAVTAAQEPVCHVSAGEQVTSSGGAAGREKDAVLAEEREALIAPQASSRSLGAEAPRSRSEGVSASPIARAALGILGVGRESERENLGKGPSMASRLPKLTGGGHTGAASARPTPPRTPPVSAPLTQPENEATEPSSRYTLVASSQAEADLASSSDDPASGPALAAVEKGGPMSKSSPPGGSVSAGEEHLTKPVWSVFNVSSGLWGKPHASSYSKQGEAATEQAPLVTRSLPEGGAASSLPEKAPLVGSEASASSGRNEALQASLAVLKSSYDTSRVALMSSYESSRAWAATTYAKLPPAHVAVSHLKQLPTYLANAPAMFRSRGVTSDAGERDPFTEPEEKQPGRGWSRISDGGSEKSAGGKGGGDVGPPEKYETWEVVRDFCCDIRVMILLAILLLLLLAMGLSLERADHLALQQNSTSAIIFFPPPLPPPPTLSPTPSGPGSGPSGPASALSPGAGLGGSSTCTGTCCSSNAPLIPTLVPTMPSVWWSNQMVDGAQVQLRAISSDMWLGADATTGRWSELGAFLSTPTEKDFLTVLRVNGTAVMLRTPEEYLLVALADGTVAASTTLHEPSTTFTVQPVDASSRHIQLIAYDGKYLAVKPDGQFYRTANPSLAEIFDVREVMALPSVRGVSLANWLLVEEWIDPGLFIRVPLFTDGLVLQIQSVYTAHWFSSEGGGATPVACSSTDPDPTYGTFYLRTLGNNTFQLRTHDHWYLSAENGGGGALFADVAQPGLLGYENFEFVFNPADPTEFLIKTAKGYYVGIGTDGTLEATTPVDGVNTGSGRRTWIGPLAFGYNEISAVRGEWQLSNVMGPSAAAEILSQHRSTWITEADFAYLAGLNINAVRIPIGYWLTQEDTPDAPFVPGGAAVLDDAFVWGAKYGISIYVTLNGAPGSQNGRESSGSRDGVPDWANVPTNIDRTLGAIEWVVKRYASSSAFFGIGLLNEPLAAGVNLDVLKQFYIDGYNVVRNHSKCAFVGMQPRVDGDPYELDSFFTKQAFTNVVVDMHFYNVFSPVVQAMPFNATLSFVSTARAEEIAEIQSSSAMVLVGQWSLGLLENVTVSDSQYEDFADVQLETYADATAGWFFFTYKMGSLSWPQWSFQSSIENNWLAQVEGGGWP